MCVEKGRRLYWWFEWPHKNLVRFVFIFSPISITWLLNLSSRSTMPPTMNSTLATPNLFKFILILGCQLTLYYRSSCWPKKQCGHRRRWLRCVVFWHPTKKMTLIVIIVYASPWHQFFLFFLCWAPWSKTLKDTSQNNATSAPLWIGSLLCVCPNNRST